MQPKGGAILKEAGKRFNRGDCKRREVCMFSNVLRKKISFRMNLKEILHPSGMRKPFEDVDRPNPARDDDSSAILRPLGPSPKIVRKSRELEPVGAE